MMYQTKTLLTCLNCFVLLYSDDTVILSDSPDDLQNALLLYEQYCVQWDLHVNTSKTKIVVFAKGKTKSFKFYICNAEIEIVNDFKYLGITFSRSGGFLKTKEHIAKQATKAMFCLLQRSKNLCLSIDLRFTNRPFQQDC